MTSEDHRRILIVGDLHANTGAGLAVVDHASALDADVVLQVGDFGYWTDPAGQKFLRKIEHRLSQRALELWWIDGNHERFDRLEAIPVTEDGRRPISEHIWHLPRGFRWQWGNTVWLAAGGAVSVDRSYRVEGATWFTREELTQAEVDRMIADGPADILVTHDASLGVPFLRARLGQDKPAWRRESAWPTGLLMRSDEHQRRVRSLVDGVRAARVFHGHHHIRYSDTLSAPQGPVEVEGLGMDLDPLNSRCLLVDANGWPLLETD